MQRSAPFFPAFRLLDYGSALKIERKMSHLNIAFDRYASKGTVMHYILVISVQYTCVTVLTLLHHCCRH